MRTSWAKLEQGGSPGEGQLKWEEGSVVSETEGRSDGSVASREGSDAGLSRGGSGGVSSTSSHDYKISIRSLPLAGLAA